LGQRELSLILWAEKRQYLYVEFKDRPIKNFILSEKRTNIGKVSPLRENKLVDNKHDYHAKTSVYG
jgi:hypothetical protein